MRSVYFLLFFSDTNLAFTFMPMANVSITTAFIYQNYLRVAATAGGEGTKRRNIATNIIGRNT